MVSFRRFCSVFFPKPDLRGGCRGLTRNMRKKIKCLG